MASPYINSPVDCSIQPDLSQLKGKSVIVTGGSSGLGLSYVEAFLSAGAYVTNADIKPSQKDYNSSSYQFIECDVRNWNDQKQSFGAALTNSPSHSVDIVVANAGIAGLEPLLEFDDRDDEPSEPDLRITQVDYIGVLYTTHLALWYFAKQKNGDEEGRDRCLILMSSCAGYLDVPSSLSYQGAKFGVRGLICGLRWSGRCRVNGIAPWFIKTPIMTAGAIERLTTLMHANGSDWAHAEDAVKAVLRIACDKSINGRTLGIVPRYVAQEGFKDFEKDDFKEEDWIYGLQEITKGSAHRPLPQDEQASK